MSDDDRRAYQREWRRKRRAERVARENAGRTRCAARIGGGAVCNGRLETVVDGLGRAVVVCAWCEKRRRGICRDCSLPVAGTVGKSLRCAAHTEAAHRATVRRSHARHRAARNARARAAYQNDPEYAARRDAYKVAWRQRNPEKVRAYKRRASLRQPAQQRVYLAAYRRKYREHYRLAARERYYREHPERPAPTCEQCGAAIPFEPPGRPPKTCDACCWPHELKRRLDVRARRAAARAAAEQLPAPTRKVRRPKHTKYAESGQRLCLGEGCDVVLTGRKKKCRRCKQRDLERALALRAERAA